MAIQTYDTQQGATLTLATDSLTLRVTQITPITASIPNIRKTNLSNTTKQTWHPGELKDYEEITVTYQNSPGVAQPSVGTVQTVTISAAVAPGGSVAESVTGTGYVRQDTELPGFSSESEDLQIKTMLIKWDGETGPTRTVGS